MRSSIEKGSLRYRYPNTGQTIICAPGTEEYEMNCDRAQERWDNVTRTWFAIAKNYPKQLDNKANALPEYRVYLDGVIVPWWQHADSERGYVDVWAYTEGGENLTLPTEARLHRLFGVVTFQAGVLIDAVI